MMLGQQNIHMQKKKVVSLPDTIYKINSKWIKYLNARAKL